MNAIGQGSRSTECHNKEGTAIKKRHLKPNGKNIEIALELLELSLVLKKSVKKAIRKK